MGIEIRNLEAAYEDRVIIPCANVTIPEGKITMMIGPNGCGKSTLLKSIARILPIKKGEVLLDGTNIKKLSQKLIAQKMAVLPQTPLVPEGITVEAPSNTELFIRGIDKCLVGEFAANVRKIRQPEPYKGKGIRYSGEHIIRKEGKKAA